MHKHNPLIRSIREMMEIAVRDNPEQLSYQFQKDEDIVSVSMRAFYESAEALGAALTELGFGKAHIACVGENSYPWIQTFVTVLMSAGVFVPLDKELPVDQMIYLLNDSDSEVVFCSEKYEKCFAERRSEIPNVKKIVCFERTADNGDFLSFEGLITHGAMLDKTAYDSLRSDENELKYLVYTSGTTGVAKGVMLSEHNIVSGIYYGLKVSHIYERGLAVLPFNHTYEAVCEILVSIQAQATVCINDSLRHVLKNIQFYKPAHIYLVPAFSDLFYDKIHASIRKQGKEKKFQFAVRLSNFLRKIGIDLRRKLFKEIHAQFGGNLRRIVCGGAPIRPEVGKFFDDIGIILTGGYGITECSPLVSVNEDDSTNNFFSAGHRLACLEWRIDKPSSDGIGEICVKGDVVMLGYYKRPDLTAEAIREGWFYTGDYGYLTEKDEIVITGRKKNIIIMSNGKNIYPEELELRISKLPYVTEVVVSGIKNEFGEDTGLAAELYVEDEGVSRENVPGDIARTLSDLPSYKRISKITYRQEPFPKTTTNKIKRG
ncbi:MAG: AMP-dependent synthetase [Ruminococcaceae bacterium]|nr:AMP-dependent synthetase [Oscillospiraceae bacterium]